MTIHKTTANCMLCPNGHVIYVSSENMPSGDFAVVFRCPQGKGMAMNAGNLAWVSVDTIPDNAIEATLQSTLLMILPCPHNKPL